MGILKLMRVFTNVGASEPSLVSHSVVKAKSATHRNMKRVGHLRCPTKQTILPNFSCTEIKFQFISQPVH